MKKLLALLLSMTLMVAVFAGCSSTTGDNSANGSTPEASSEPAVSNEPIEQTPTSTVPTPEINSLGVGSMMVYDFGNIQLHAYETKDAIGDENFIVETPDELILIELVGFNNNIEELQSYVTDLGKPLNNVIVAYHPAGGYVPNEAEIFASDGLGEAALVPGFVEAFGDAFNGNMPTEYELVEPGTMTIGGVEFNVIQTDDAFDLEIPAINVYMTHMVGSNTHNILPSVEAIDGMINQMNELQAKGYSLILSGHDIPRTIEITTEKINYLETLKELAASSDSAETFIAAVNEAFPDYMGGNYLEMSAGGLFAE
jgi:hypothetical protein